MIAATYPSTTDYLARGEWQERTLPSYLAETAESCPTALAVVDHGTRLSYSELAERVGKVADGLAALGVGGGDVICVVLPNWWEAIAVMHATLAQGAVVNPVVPIYRDREIEFIIGQGEARVVVIPHVFRGFDYVAMMARICAELESPPTVVVVRPEGALPDGFLGWDELAAAPASTRPAVDAGAVCLLLYTSGTTADPKGVLHTHQTLGYEDRSIIALHQLTAQDTVFMPSPVTHITGFLYGVVMPPMLGVPSVLLDIWDPQTACDLVESERCRFTLAATPFLIGLVDQYALRGMPSALRVFACGGADVPPKLVRRGRDVMGSAVVRVYGSSEFPTASCGTPEDSVRIAAETDGRPIGAIETFIADPVDGVGELLLRGPELFLGYLDPALNDAAFTTDGCFRTGDLASIDDDGAITIRGRIKDIIVRGAEKISAKEIEDLIFEHPRVREVAVIGMPDDVLGERVCAVIVPTGPDEPDVAEISDFLARHRIARQKMPERIVVVDELPKTASGKVQKFLLRKQISTSPTNTREAQR
jgi:cyclohexanecarboxylate-CoA ligase